MEKTDGCWLWTGGSHGGKWKYGVFSLSHGNQIVAHKASWIFAYGPIPDGLWVLHHCDNPPCVRPTHLFLGTAKDNSQDMVAKERGRHKLSRGDLTAIGEQYSDGVQVITIARAFGIGPNYVTDLARKYGWWNPRRRESVRHQQAG